MLGWHPRQTLCMKQSSGIGRGHGRSKAAGTIRAQKQEIKDLKARAKELEAEIKALREGQNASTVKTSDAKKSTTNLQPGPALDRTFHEAWSELHRDREFPRIPDLRQKLNMSREVFDEEIRRLRDSMTVQLMQADESLMTKDEIRDCWVDENNYRMGTMFWNVR